jgi:hypothetical protein
MPIIRSSRLCLCYCCIWCVMPWLLVVGGLAMRLGEGNFPHPGRISCCSAPNSWWSAVQLCVRDEGNFPHPRLTDCCSAPNSRPPTTKALHTICGNNTSIVSSSWWWAYRCPKHVEQIIIAIKHSVASSWFSSLRLYNDARTNIHQMQYICLSRRRRTSYTQ